MDAAFSTAARRIERPRHRVLGLLLKPLTVGHLFLLEDLDCSFLPWRDPDDATMADLVMGVFVCAQDHRRAARNIGRWWVKLFMKFWGWRCRREYFPHAAYQFSFYLNQELALPALRSKGKPGSDSVPVQWRLLNMLLVDFHVGSIDAAMDTPVAMANCLWGLEASRRGTAEILSERQRGFLAWVQEQERIRLEREKGGV